MPNAQGHVTTERLTTLVNEVGVKLSKGQVARLLTSGLDGFVKEDAAVLDPCGAFAAETDALRRGVLPPSTSASIASLPCAPAITNWIGF